MSEPTSRPAARVFLVVVDESPELANALRYACRRAKRTEQEGTPGVVLLDLPDLDSVESAHRDIAERMTGMVDVIVWVTDST